MSGYAFGRHDLLYSQPRRRNQTTIDVATTPQTSQNNGYANGEAFSGIGMFMPYTPARNVSG